MNYNDFVRVFDDFPVAVAIFQGPEFTYAYVNPRHKQLVFVDAEALVGKKLLDVFPDLAVRPIMEFFESVYTSGDPVYLYDYEAYTKNEYGEAYLAWFNIVIQALRNDQGVIEGIIVHATDVSEIVRAKKTLEDNEKRQRVFADVTKLLTTSFEQGEILKSFAQIAVPDLGDLCFFDVVKYGNVLERVAWAGNPEFLGDLSEIVQFTPEKGGSHIVLDALQSGQTQFVEVVTEKWLEENASSAEHLQFMKELGFHSQLTIPSMLRGEVFAVLTFCLIDKTRSFTAEDIYLGEDLGQRVAQAMHNAALYNQAQAEISERKRVQSALLESEKKFRAMSDNLPVKVWLTDVNGSCIYTNNQWRQYTGQSIDQALGLGWLDLIHPEDKKDIQEGFKEAGFYKVPYKKMYRLKGVEEKYRWHLASGLPDYDPSGDFKGYIGVVIDIHERKLAEDALIQQAEKLRLSVQAGKIAIWDLDFIEGVAYWSKEMDEMFGQKSRELEGRVNEVLKRYRATIHPEDATYVQNVTDSALQAGADMFQLEFRIVHPQGRVAWISENGEIAYKNGVPVKMYGTCIDITERKLLQQQKDDFLGVASHELKTPVTSLKGYIEILQDEMLERGEDVVASQLQRADSKIDKLVQLINDLLDVTKMDAGKLDFTNKPYDFDKMVAEVIESLQYTSRKHKLEWYGRTGAMVHGDCNRIEQVVTNLITNAIRYSPGADRIILRSEKVGNEVQFSVQDFGVGISLEDIDQIFSRFYRVNSSDNKYGGLGLGLFISKEILMRQSGDVWVESAKGNGATFTFSLPIWDTTS